MDLQDLQPKTSRIYLETMDKEYILRPWQLRDQIWLQQEYGDKIESIFSGENIDIVAICRMSYRLLQDCDKGDFSVVTSETFDENGEPINERVGGWQRLALSVSDMQEQMSMYLAVVECVGVSMPEVDELKEQFSKKKVTKTTKKRKKQIGQK